MMYFSPQNNVLAAADPRLWGRITAPRSRSVVIADGFRWIGDNGCFTSGWDEKKWRSWLERMLPNQPSCVMVTMPDTVADAKRTLDQFDHYAPSLRLAAWPLGLVAQDGLESLDWPQDYDCLFVGGSTQWKMSEAADFCIRKAKKDGKWVHVGRVNSVKRIKHFMLRGVDSCDGTTICFSPTKRFRVINDALLIQPLLHLD